MPHQAGVQNDGADEAPFMSRCERTVDGLRLDRFAERPLLFEPISVMRYDGTHPEQLTDNQWEEGAPAWPPRSARR